MAHILFGADLSLALPHSGGQYGDPNADLSSPNIAAIVPADGKYGGQHYCPRALGEKDHPAELIDYLGVLPVMENGVRTPIPSPQCYKSCDKVNIPESISTQLTMFCAGTVSVSDNVVADKAQIVLASAEKSTSMQATTPLFRMPMASSIRASAPCEVPYGPSLQGSMKGMQPEMPEIRRTTAAHLSVGERLEDGHAQQMETLLVPCQAIVPTALPIARKASLARFLENRRERLCLAAPYLAQGAGAPNTFHLGRARQSTAISTLKKYYNNLLGAPNAKQLTSDLVFARDNTVKVKDHTWITSVENSKQASESESAT